MHHFRDCGFDHRVASEITSRALYQKRRDLLKLAAASGVGAALIPWTSAETVAQAVRPGKLAALSGSTNLAPTNPTPATAEGARSRLEAARRWLRRR